MKQKRSSINVVHLFLRLSVLLQSASSLKETAPDHLDAAPDEEKMALSRMKKNGALRRMLQPNKNAAILKITKRRSQLPKSIEKIL